MKTFLYIIILITLLSCSQTTITYQGEWTGSGFATIQNDQNLNYPDSEGRKIHFDNVKLTISRDTFEILGLDKKLKGIIDANQDTTLINLLNFDSYEYETLSKQNELEKHGTITVDVSGGHPLTKEAIWINDDNSITVTFYRDRNEEDSRYYELKLKKTDG